MPTAPTKTQAEVQRMLAEADKFAAQAAQAEAEARQNNLLADAAKLEYDLGVIRRDRELEKRAREQAGDWEQRFMRFHDAVSSTTVDAAINCLAQWFRVDKANKVKNPHYKIQFNSPGGSVWDGLALFDEIQHFRRNGVKFTTSTIGMAASMAGILLQAGDVRRMAPESWVLIHKVSFNTGGAYDSVADRVKHLGRVQDRILDIFAERAKQAGENGTASKPITKAQLKKAWDRTDYWLSSDDCLKLGIVDEVR